MREINSNNEDWNLFGHLNQYNGLGVFFSLFDRSNKLNPSISAAQSDGDKRWNSLTEIPSNGKYKIRIKYKKMMSIKNLSIEDKFLRNVTIVSTFTIPHILVYGYPLYYYDFISAGVYWKIHDAGEPMVFKLTVLPDSVYGQARFMSNPKWTDAFVVRPKDERKIPITFT